MTKTSPLEPGAASTSSTLRDYYYVTKPNVISLLVFCGAASYVASAGWHTNFLSLILVGVSVWLGSAAANTIGSYFDRDIDAIMRRTKSRPIPSGRISPNNAAVYGIGLLALSLALSYYLSPYSSLAMLVGFLDYTIVYSFALKRRSWLNIILGGFSGVMPVLVGYFASTNPVIPLSTAIFLGFLVFFWIPEHIWSLAIRFREDYTEAKIPMLPVVISERRSVQVIAITTIVMVLYSIIPVFYSSFHLHLIYFLVTGGLGGVMLLVNAWLLKDPSPARAWTVFKISSPYLFFVFIGIMVDVLVYSK
ncbi:MAG: heme o synthase [Thaumarchaeota archaeon]|nr:heme o synthase [Nitrososphaerota archaeon]